MADIDILKLTLPLAIGAALLFPLRPPQDVAAAPADIQNAWPAPGFSSSGLGWDGSHLWITNQRTAVDGGFDRVSKHDPATGAIVSSFDMPVGDYFHGLEFDIDGNMITDDLYSQIVRLTTDGRELTRFPAQGLAYSVAHDQELNRLYQIDFTSNPKILYALDADTGAVLDSVELELVDGQPGDVAWDSQTLWVTGLTTNTISRVDPETGETLATIEWPGGNPVGLAWDSDCLWVSDTDVNEVYQIDHGQSDLPACPPSGGDPDPDPTDPQPEPEPDPDDPDPQDPDPSDPDGTEPTPPGDPGRGGCQVAPPLGSAASTLFALCALAIVCFARRRRRRDPAV